jgi:hypothetical protein
VMPGSGDGDVMFATGGRMGRPPGVCSVPDSLPKDCSKTLGSSEKGLWTVLK